MMPVPEHKQRLRPLARALVAGDHDLVARLLGDPKIREAIAAALVLSMSNPLYAAGWRELAAPDPEPAIRDLSN